MLDINGRLLQLFTDRGIHSVPPYPTLTQTWDMAGRALRVVSAESGTSYALADARGFPIYARDARGVELRRAYDALRRPTTLAAADTGAGTSWIAERTVYGDDVAIGPLSAAANLLGRVFQSFDQAGVRTHVRYDFKGNLLEERRQLMGTLDGASDWTAPYLDPFVTTRDYDALDRVIPPVLPRRSVAPSGENVPIPADLP